MMSFIDIISSLDQEINSIMAEAAAGDDIVDNTKENVKDNTNKNVEETTSKNVVDVASSNFISSEASNVMKRSFTSGGSKLMPVTSLRKGGAKSNDIVGRINEAFDF